MIAQVVPVLFAFGSNLGGRGDTIRAAQRELAATEGIANFTASPLRETVALTLAGPDPLAPKYVNGVAVADTTLGPHALLDVMQRLEHEFGRVRGERWADRTLDIDLILFGGRVISDERLTVPHPRAHERDFVLAPWLALDPNAVLMGHGRVAELLERIGDTTAPFAEEPAPAQSDTGHTGANDGGS
ncbi:2-amino-4-hydroxy-6-hydroxymethyldihydropteridine diphosphokinase [Leucobacter sp. G161]|uniref:2-amino-4-hydroxy-6- hydroxymethyldihydropteridine diphosphokinase n=1 Tax=Leucobacter sp. G161 TaxID=663704 RepID=UPI00073B8314|nr:2-amino-4-hydroxy-6-hydroxymethyldihydropteridine diphosphokinase [Leucobacter sp. G161]KUF06445.1 2-amino-4-hydroxy-6-hydroxymethyldihydropteridine pyrophosphokinase [Leucobacter sp. G161]